MNLDYYSLRFQKLQQSRRILSTKLGRFQGILHLALGIPASLHLQGFASFLNNEHPDSSFAVFLRVSGLLDGMAPVGLSKLWDGNCVISKRFLEAIKNHENNESKNRSLCLKGLLWILPPAHCGHLPPKYGIDHICLECTSNHHPSS